MGWDIKVIGGNVRERGGGGLGQDFFNLLFQPIVSRVGYGGLEG